MSPILLKSLYSAFPAGFKRRPQVAVFGDVGGFLGEADLIAIAYVFEQGAQGHVEPDVVATLAEIESVLSGDEASN